MPNQEPQLDGLTVEDLVAAIVDRLTVLERNPAWLAKKLGIADSSLRFWLFERPEQLKVSTWLAILVVLGVTWEDVVATPRQAAAVA